MKKNLTKIELKQLIGGISLGVPTEGVSIEKKNTNRTEFCQCTYSNMNKTSNVNNVYACNCVCI